MKKLTKEELAEYIRKLMQYVLRPAIISPAGALHEGDEIEPGKILTFGTCLIPDRPSTYDVSEALQAICKIYPFVPDVDTSVYVRDSEGFMKNIKDLSELEPGFTIISEEEYRKNLGRLL